MASALPIASALADAPLPGLVAQAGAAPKVGVAPDQFGAAPAATGIAQTSIAATVGGGSVVGRAENPAKADAFDPAKVPEPKWFQELLDSYLGGGASVFLLHGNTNDLIPEKQADGKLAWYLSAKDFLAHRMSRTKSIVAQYDVANGLTDPVEKKLTARAKLLQKINIARELAGLGSLDELPVNASAFVRDVLQSLAFLPGEVSGDKTGVALILDSLEFIAKNQDMSFTSEQEAAAYYILENLPSDPQLLTTDNIIIGITKRLEDVLPRVVKAQGVDAIHVPYPDQELRKFFLHHEIKKMQEGPGGDSLKIEMTLDNFARVTNGLTLFELKTLLRGAKHKGQTVTFDMVSRSKKEIIETKLNGLVEFVESDHGMEDVAGMEEAKAALQTVIDTIKGGRSKEAPMGLLFAGAQGTGKTYLAEGFAKGCGMTVIKLKNVKNKWVGDSEKNLAMIFDLVNALGNVVLVFDEVERFFASGEASDGGTNSAIIGKTKEFMSDTKHRGSIITLFLSNRPDLLDIDLLRPGRIDKKIPLFYAESAEERRAHLEVGRRKLDLKYEDGIVLDHVLEGTNGYASSDLFEIMRFAAEKATIAGHGGMITQVDLDTAFQNFVPSRDIKMLEYMELQAVAQASDKSMLPTRYRDITTTQLQDRMAVLRSELAAQRMTLR